MKNKCIKNKRKHQSKALWSVLSLLVLAFFTGCASKDPDLLIPDEECAPLGDLRPICGLTRPEDIEILPGMKYLVFSQMGDFFTGSPGQIGILDVENEEHATLERIEQMEHALWGDKNCPGLPGEKLSPHGIHLSQRSDGRMQLLVVNHGGRESVEFYEVFFGGLNSRLLWRGCVVFPEPSFLNDVTAAGDDKLYVTHMLAKDSTWAFVKAMLGMKTGYVWHWQKGRELKILESSRGPFLNGIQLSAGGKYLFVNMYRGGVRKIRLKDGEIVGEADIPGPDNSSWSLGGSAGPRLLVASHTPSFSESRHCMKHSSLTCGYPFSIVAVNPDNMETETLLSHRGPPMGAGTVAVQVGDKLYIGSFAGNRMVVAPLKQ